MCTTIETSMIAAQNHDIHVHTSLGDLPLTGQPPLDRLETPVATRDGLAALDGTPTPAPVHWNSSNPTSPEEASWESLGSLDNVTANILDGAHDVSNWRETRPMDRGEEPTTPPALPQEEISWESFGQIDHATASILDGANTETETQTENQNQNSLGSHLSDYEWDEWSSLDGAPEETPTPPTSPTATPAPQDSPREKEKKRKRKRDDVYDEVSVSLRRHAQLNPNKRRKTRGLLPVSCCNENVCPAITCGGGIKTTTNTSLPENQRADPPGPCDSVKAQMLKGERNSDVDFEKEDVHNPNKTIPDRAELDLSSMLEKIQLKD